MVLGVLSGEGYKGRQEGVGEKTNRPVCSEVRERMYARAKRGSWLTGVYEGIRCAGFLK